MNITGLEGFSVSLVVTYLIFSFRIFLHREVNQGETPHMNEYLTALVEMS
jgi:hypothetical protein